MQLIQYIRLQILESVITLCFKSPYPFQAWNGLVVTYKSQRSAKLPSLAWYVSDHRGERRKKKKHKATDTSKPVKNVMVFVKDLASAVAVEEHHSWIRRLRSSGEMVNIKGLCRSLPFEGSWQEICLWPSAKEKDTWGFFFFWVSRQSLPWGSKKEKKNILQFQVNKFTVVRTVQTFCLYLSHSMIVTRPS